MAATNRRVLLKSRPQGEPTSADFEIVDGPVPDPQEGEYLSRTIWMSLDPYMRGRMSEAKGYAANAKLGEALGGGTVGQVLKSKNPKFKEGDYVAEYAGWQSYAVSNGAGVMKLDPGVAPISTALSVLGMPGMTAWWGLMQIGKPKAGETVVVSGASGAVGSLVGQIARLKGCRVVGIAGGPKKCAYVTDTLGFDAVVDYKAGRMGEALRAAAPKGIDIYFENVGGEVLDAVLPLMNQFARIPMCGHVAEYNQVERKVGPDKLPDLFLAILGKRLTIRGFVVSDFMGEMQDFVRDMGGWLGSGKIRYREEITEGIENAPRAFQAMLRAENFGKPIVRVSPDPTL
jgi:NADPH-dependent curcumin reductase